MNTLLIALLAACAGTAPSTMPEAAPAASAAPDPVVAEAEEPDQPQQPAVNEDFKVRFEPELSIWNEANNTITFSPDSQRKQAEYTRFVIDLASFQELVPERPKEPIDLVLHITGVSETTKRLDDEHMPQPMGGFRYIDWTAVVSSVSE